MGLISDASPEELASPYYIQNKLICEAFEQFILEKNGKVKGKFNAWSFVVYGKIPHHNKGEFKIKKSTYTSTGNLLMSSKKQSLQLESIWFAKLSESDCSDFLIEKSKWYKQSKKIDSYYSIQTKTPQHSFIKSLIKILTPIFNTKNIWKITYKNRTLKIETRSVKLEFEIIAQLLKLG